MAVACHGYVIEEKTPKSSKEILPLDASEFKWGGVWICHEKFSVNALEGIKWNLYIPETGAVKLFHNSLMMRSAAFKIRTLLKFSIIYNSNE